MRAISQIAGGGLHSYKQESQVSCRSELSKKSVENTLESAWDPRGGIPESPLVPTPMVMSSQSMPSKAGSPKWGVKESSHVSIGEGGWSKMLDVLSIWLWRSSIKVTGPPGSTPSNGFPVVLSRKSSRRPLPVPTTSCSAETDA